MNRQRLVIMMVMWAVGGGARAGARGAADTPPAPRRRDAPPTPQQIETSIDRGVDFLVGFQNKDGSWGSATRTKGLNIYAPIPGAHHAFRAATTALCISALIEVGVEDRPEARAALDKGEAFLLSYLPRVRRASTRAIYNIWAHAYGIQALTRMRGRHADDPEKLDRIDTVIRQQIDLLRRYQYVTGGWGYYDFYSGTQHPAGGTETSFTTATVLVALREAKAAGVEPPQKIVDHAIRAINRQRKPDNTSTDRASSSTRCAASTAPVAASAARRRATARCVCGATRPSPTTCSTSGSRGCSIATAG